ncbi:MAG: hypothetical protein E6Q97_04375 [Desulfurellales bacterium]|nr:MAG: hypothetical protein E6Q97_04375 [Desulfurellales bacterium]
MRIEQILAMFYDTAETDWRQVGDAWVHKDAKVGPRARLDGGGIRSGTVTDNATVYGDALVYGNATVCGNAIVTDNARVCGDATVTDNARVCGDAQLFFGGYPAGEWQGSPLQIRGSAWPVYHAGPGLIGVGCQVHAIKDWFKAGFAEQVAADNGCDLTAKLRAEYLRYAKLIRADARALFPVTKGESP